MWNNINAAPEDSILGLTEAFKNEKNAQKVNLGVGVYKDDQGRTPILSCVKKAEQILLEKEVSKSYLPISGDPLYASCVQKLLFGQESEIITSRRASTIHAPGGTGALRVGADLLKKFRSDAKVWVSSPTWANHRGIFGAAGFEFAEYPYYNAFTKQIDFELLLECLDSIPAQDIVLLHACCHNPSGVDLTSEQWREVVAISQKRGWLPFLDFAYQGFGEGVDEDRIAVELFGAAEVDFFVASSFSKNFGLYNERTGAMTIVSPTQNEAEVAMSHLKVSARVCYSNPPAHGGLTTVTILDNKELYELWLEELGSMRKRIVQMRLVLVEGLNARGVQTDFSYIADQRGMFSFSGLTDYLVKWLRENKAIYVVGGGRINLAGLNTGNIDYVCDSIAEAMKI